MENFIFCAVFELLLFDVISCNPSFLLTTGDFNVRTSFWWRKDSITLEGTQTKTLACSY